MVASTTLAQVSDLLQASDQGDQVAHRQLLEAVHRLQLEVELPHETANRVKFQVSCQRLGRQLLLTMSQAASEHRGSDCLGIWSTPEASRQHKTASHSSGAEQGSGSRGDYRWYETILLRV